MTPSSVQVDVGQVSTSGDTAIVIPCHAAPGRPKVSVMVITYNHEKYIAQAIESVLMQQTNFHFEINVIEDCSTDRTQEIVMRYVDKYPDIVKPFFNEKNIGFKVTQKNFYRGFLTLTGEYLAILEGDDYWTSPHKLQKQVDFLDAHPEFAICGHNTVKVYEDGSQEPHRFLYWGQRSAATVEDVINLRSFFHTTGILYRNVFQGLPPRQFRNKWSCDIFIMIAHAVHGHVHHLDEDMAVYRAHPAGRFSGMTPAEGWFFNIDGLRRYNAWLGYRYYRSFAESIVRYCEHVLSSHGKDAVAPLSVLQLAKIRLIWGFYRSVLAVINLPREIKLRLKGVHHLTRLEGLPSLPEQAHWDLIWGLNVKLLAGREMLPGRQVMLLTASRVNDPEAQQRHAISQRFEDLEPDTFHSVSIWAKPLTATMLQVHIRDSVDAETGAPRNEGEAKCDLSTSSVITVTGLSGVEITAAADGWLKITSNVRTADTRLFVYLGMLRNVDSSHVFEANGEQLLFGGIEIFQHRPA